MKKTGCILVIALSLNFSWAQQVYERFTDFAPVLEQTQSDSIYVLNFWATWCAPCIKELPYFEQLHQEFAEKKIKVILVSLDFRKDLETKLKPFLSRQQFSASTAALIDSQQQLWIDKIDPSWSGAIPATLVYKGAVRQFKEGEFENFEELVQMITPFFDTKN